MTRSGKLNCLKVAGVNAIVQKFTMAFVRFHEHSSGSKFGFYQLQSCIICNMYIPTLVDTGRATSDTFHLLF